MAIDTKDKRYAQQFDLWQQVRAAIKGKYAVIDIVSCLPAPQYNSFNSYSGMSQEQQEAAQRCNIENSLRIQSYWARGRFFNATARTHESLGGMIWSKKPETIIPQRLNYLVENADGTGSTLKDTAQNATDEVIAVGRYGILVDMPSTESGLTQAQLEQTENLPKLIQYKAEQIIYFRVSGRSKAIDEVRLAEVHSVQKSEFEWEDVCYIRRLVLIDGIYTNQLYNDKDELIESIQPRANGAFLNEIPFQFFGADNNDANYSKVPLYDLANINLGHFVLDCDNRDNLHFHGQGMTNIYTSMDAASFNEQNPNGLDVGAKGKNILEQGDKVEILQIDATGAIASEMERDEQRMIKLGAQLVQDTSSNQTLGAKEMEFGSSTSTLKRIADNISDGLTQCLIWAGQFLGVNEEVKYSLNKDFVIDEMSPQMVQSHMALVQGGILPAITLNETARKAGLTKLDNEEIADALENQNLMGDGDSEEVATLQAENDMLKERLANNG